MENNNNSDSSAISASVQEERNGKIENLADISNTEQHNLTFANVL